MIPQLTLKLIRTITLNRILIWALTAILGIVSLTAYENRISVVSYFTTPKMNVHNKTFAVSPVTRNSINEIVVASPDILAINVVSTDIRANQSNIVFFFSEDADFVGQYQPYLRSAASINPLFSSNEVYNALIIRLINGEFLCVPFDSSPLAQTNSSFTSLVKATCMASIPSYYGYFSGFVTFFLRQMPSIAKQEQLKLNIETLANEIYFRDVLSSQSE